MTLIFDIRALRANLRSMTCNELAKISVVINLVDNVAQTPSSRRVAVVVTLQRAYAESVAEEKLLVEGCYDPISTATMMLTEFGMPTKFLQLQNQTGITLSNEFLQCSHRLRTESTDELLPLGLRSLDFGRIIRISTQYLTV